MINQGHGVGYDEVRAALNGFEASRVYDGKDSDQRRLGHGLRGIQALRSQVWSFHWNNDGEKFCLFRNLGDDALAEQYRAKRLEEDCPRGKLSFWYTYASDYGWIDLGHLSQCASSSLYPAAFERAPHLLQGPERMDDTWLGAFISESGFLMSEYGVTFFGKNLTERGQYQQWKNFDRVGDKDCFKRAAVLRTYEQVAGIFQAEELATGTFPSEARQKQVLDHVEAALGDVGVSATSSEANQLDRLAEMLPVIDRELARAKDEIAATGVSTGAAFSAYTAEDFTSNYLGMRWGKEVITETLSDPEEVGGHYPMSRAFDKVLGGGPRDVTTAAGYDGAPRSEAHWQLECIEGRKFHYPHQYYANRWETNLWPDWPGPDGSKRYDPPQWAYLSVTG